MSAACCRRCLVVALLLLDRRRLRPGRLARAGQACRTSNRACTARPRPPPLGVGGVLVGLGDLLQRRAAPGLSLHEVLVTLFLFIPRRFPPT
ncbi:MAG: hypothetical protein MZV65_00220 [Chromatiales bacterium]|nr:hypothetical protein [Chromatiales bacterium]